MPSDNTEGEEMGKIREAVGSTEFSDAMAAVGLAFERMIHGGVNPYTAALILAEQTRRVLSVNLILNGATPLKACVATSNALRNVLQVFKGELPVSSFKEMLETETSQLSEAAQNVAVKGALGPQAALGQKVKGLS